MNVGVWIMNENARVKRLIAGLMATALMWSGLACTPRTQEQGGQPTPADKQQGEPTAPVPHPVAPDGGARNANQPAPANSQEQPTALPVNQKLPPIPTIKGEAELKASLAEWVSQVSQAGEGGLSPELEIELIGEVLAVAQQQLADEKAEHELFLNKGMFVYKYVLRYLSERLLFLYPEAEKKYAALCFFTDGQGHWVPLNSEWDFKSFENACYMVLYGSCSVSPSNGIKAGKASLPSPLWSTQALLAVRNRDFEAMSALHEMAGLGEAPQWPIETFRQLFTYATTFRSQRQFNEICKVLGQADLKGVSWAEIGYGTGMIFPTLREHLGPQSHIYGCEIDNSCHVLVAAMEKTGQAGWGHVDLIKSKMDDCCLPENSVDYIHPGMVHIADGPEERMESDWVPLINSFKKALKPGGILIIDNGGEPPLERVRHLMQLTDMEEVAVHYNEQIGQHDPFPVYYAAYRVKK